MDGKHKPVPGVPVKTSISCLTIYMSTVYVRRGFKHEHRRTANWNSLIPKSIPASLKKSIASFLRPMAEAAMAIFPETVTISGFFISLCFLGSPCSAQSPYYTESMSKKLQFRQLKPCSVTSFAKALKNVPCPPKLLTVRRVAL